VHPKEQHHNDEYQVDLIRHVNFLKGFESATNRS